MFKKMSDNASFALNRFKIKMSNKANRKSFVQKSIVGLILGILKYFIIICIAFVFVYPFLYMIVTSVKSPTDLADSTVSWIPTTIWRDNFVYADKGLNNYLVGFKNSLILTLVSTLGHILSAALAGYALARYRFKYKNILVVILILQIIVPPQVITIPSYILYAKLGMLKTYLPIILPTFFGNGLKGGIFIFIFRQFYMGIPAELEEAARVDGCGPYSTFARIILPMSKAPFLVTLMLSLVWHWTDNYESVLFITDSKLRVLVANLPQLYNTLNMEAETEAEYQQQAIYTEGVVMAATFMIVLPILIAYFFLQRQFTQGIERSGIVG